MAADQVAAEAVREPHLPLQVESEPGGESSQTCAIKGDQDIIAKPSDKDVAEPQSIGDSCLTPAVKEPLAVIPADQKRCDEDHHPVDQSGLQKGRAEFTPPSISTL